MRKLRLMALLALFALGLPLVALAQDGPEAHEVTIKAATQLKVKYPGGSVSLGLMATSLPDEFMVPASAPELAVLARSFGVSLSWDGKALVSRKGNQTQRLELGQQRFPDEPTGRQLEVVAQEVEGQPHVPLSILEDLLGARLTVQGKNAWLEPLIRSVKIDGQRLVIDSTLPVRCKTFSLREPDRYVIDIPGAVLDAGSNKIEHPQLGTVRLGQFELGPAVSRIVVPTAPGVSLRPASGTPGQLAFHLSLPVERPTAAPAQAFPGEKITSVVFEPMVGGHRLVLSASGPIQYEWRRYKEPDNRFVLDIPKAALVGPKQDFPAQGSFLQNVRVSQFSAEPAAVVRVVMELSKPAQTRLTPGDTPNSLVIEVLDQTPVEYTSNQGYGATSFPKIGGVICIDAGHGGSDPGAINRALGVCEADITLDICFRLAEILKRDGWNVVMTRTEDVDVSWAGSSASQELGARVKVAQDYGADLFVSVHCNSAAGAGANGTSVHYYKSSDYLLAQELHGNLLSATGRANRGIQKNRFYVLSHSRMPSVLIETAFLSNMTEGKLLNTPEYRQRIAEGIAHGLRQYASRYMNRTTANR
ncbi:MAG: hypothetical protein AMXMBFR33_52590 [Candidatus Xenobia bacterium]